MQDQTTAGSVVFHGDWDMFPLIFYQNSHNYYIVGLDPTFMYKKDPAKYQLFEDITMGRTSENLAKTIQEEFRADYIMVEAEGQKKFVENLQISENIDLVYQDDEAKIFKIK